MTQHILIVGGGVGGTMVANLLARSLRPHEAEITLIASSDRHIYMPTWLYMPFNALAADSEHLVRKESGYGRRMDYSIRRQSRTGHANCSAPGSSVCGHL